MQFTWKTQINFIIAIILFYIYFKLYFNFIFFKLLNFIYSSNSNWYHDMQNFIYWQMYYFLNFFFNLSKYTETRGRLCLQLSVNSITKYHYEIHISSFLRSRTKYQLWKSNLGESFFIDFYLEQIDFKHNSYKRFWYDVARFLNKCRFSFRTLMILKIPSKACNRYRWPTLKSLYME